MVLWWLLSVFVVLWLMCCFDVPDFLLNGVGGWVEGSFVCGLLCFVFWLLRVLFIGVGLLSWFGMLWV